MSDPMSTQDEWRRLQLSLLETLQRKMDSVGVQVLDIRERLIQLETHGFKERIDALANRNELLRTELTALQNRITIQETQGRIFTAGVSAIVAVIVSVLAGTIIWAIKGS